MNKILLIGNGASIQLAPNYYEQDFLKNNMSKILEESLDEIFEMCRAHIIN